MKTQIASTNPNAQPTSKNNSAPAPHALLRQLTAALGKRLAQAAQSSGPNEVSPVNRESSQNPAHACMSGGKIVNSNSAPPPIATTPAQTRTAQPPEEFCDLGVPAMKSSARNGKIARMPLEVREEVNEMLRKGHTYQMIADKLENLGYPNINAANISAWKHGGYAEWLAEQQRSERNLTLPFALDRCTRNVQLDRVQQNALILASSRLTEIFAHFDIKRALEVLYEKPQLLPAFIASLSSIGRCSSDLTKTFETVHNREQTLRDQLTPDDGSRQPEEAHSETVENRSSRRNEAHFDEAQPLRDLSAFAVNLDSTPESRIPQPALSSTLKQP